MTSVYENLCLDDDDVFTKTSCLFQKYDGSSSISSCSRSSKSSEITSKLNIPDIERKTIHSSAAKPPSGNSRRVINRVTRDFSSSSLENSPTEAIDETSCESCGSTTGRYHRHSCKRHSLQTNSSISSQDTTSTRCISYWGSPSYERGSWRRRFRAERNTEIDLTPLLDVLKRIDNINTSMGIPVEEYTKNLPKQTGDEENDNAAFITNEKHAFRELFSDTNCSSHSLKLSHNINNDINNVNSRCDIKCAQAKEIMTREVETFDSEQCLPEHNSSVINSHPVTNIDNNNNERKFESDSEFDEIFEDAVNYNMKTDKSPKIQNECKYQKHAKQGQQKFRPQRTDTISKNKQNVDNSRNGHSLDNYLSSKCESSDHPIEIKVGKKRRKSKGYLNRSFLAARSRKDSIEKDKLEYARNVNKDNNVQCSEANKLQRINNNSKSYLMRISQNNEELYQSKEKSSDDESKRLINSALKNERGEIVLRKTADVELKDNLNNVCMDTDTFFEKRRKDTVFDDNSCCIDKIPGTYEEFNESLEEASLNGAMKRSSIAKRPNSVKMVVTEEAEEKQTPKTKERRRSSVSHLTAFWESKLSTSYQDNAEDLRSDTDDNGNSNAAGEIPDFNYAQGLKKTVQGNVLLQENAASTETGTDEDEKFRRIQSKLENMCKQSSRMNIRRKSILKNKGETSTFLTEFLTVPATRTRNSDSESGSNSQQSIKPEQLAKRRVSFQNSVNQDSSTSSESESQSEENENESSNESTGGNFNVYSKDNSTYRNLPSYGSNIRIENAENEHIVWRKEDIEKEHKEATDESFITKDGIDQRTLNGSRCSKKANLFEKDKNREDGKKQENLEGPKNDNGCFHEDFFRNKTLILSNNQDCVGKVDNNIDNTNSHNGKTMPYESKVLDTHNNTSNGVDKQNQLKAEKCLTKTDNIQSDTSNDICDKAVRSNDINKDTTKPRRRAKLFSIAGEENDDEKTSLLENHVELDSSDSSDVELSWRTRGYSADFYMSRKSTTGSEIIDKFRQVLRKRSRDTISKRSRRALKESKI